MDYKRHTVFPKGVLSRSGATAGHLVGAAVNLDLAKAVVPEVAVLGAG